MSRDWAARIGAAIAGGMLLAVLLAIAVIRWYPDARGLNRLYAGIFAGVAAWIATIFGCLLADDGRTAWRRAGAGIALSATAIAIAAALERGN